MRYEHESPREPSYQDVLRAYASLSESFLAHPSSEQARRLWTQEQRLLREFAKPGRFALGQLVLAPGIEAVLTASFHSPVEFLIRHQHGDWGELDPEDRRENEQSLRRGSRLLSSYRTRQEDNLWVITEGDRTVTTLLLPEEY